MNKLEIIELMINSAINNRTYQINTNGYQNSCSVGTRFNGACATPEMASYTCIKIGNGLLIDTRVASRVEINEVIEILENKFNLEKQKGEDANINLLDFILNLTNEILTVFNKKAAQVESMLLPIIELGE